MFVRRLLSSGFIRNITNKSQAPLTKRCTAPVLFSSTRSSLSTPIRSCFKSNFSSQKKKIIFATFSTFSFGTCAFYLTTPSNIAETEPSTINQKKKSGGPFLSQDFIADAVSLAIPALVNIVVEVNNGWYGGGISTGSGFIISEDGYIVTNNHVVQAGLTGGGKVIITLSNGKKYRGFVHSTDKASDLALVKIEERYKDEKFPVMQRGTSSTLKPGQWVVALGSPLRLSNTVTAGIISSVARSSSEIGLSQSKLDYIQTDAAINVGNSGGPLINIHGEVIGINTMKTAEGSGIGFAIPMDTAWQILRQLRQNRKVVRPWIGMKMVTLDSRVIRFEKKQNPNFPPIESGIMITNVAPGSPADKGGLKDGDIITSFDGSIVKTTKDILDSLGMEIGKKIKIIILRDGTERTIQITTEAAAK